MVACVASNEESDLSSSDSDSNIGQFSDEFVADFIDVFGDELDEDGEEFEGFPFEMPEQVKWTKNGQPTRSADPDLPENIPHPGSQVSFPEGAKAIDYFQLFYGNELLLKILEWTNLNADKKLPAKGWDAEQWHFISLEELQAYFGVMLISNSLLMTPRSQRYFISDNGKWIYHTHIRKIFSQHRFRDIQSYIHFCNPNITHDEMMNDRLYAVRPIIEHLQAEFKEVFCPNREISVDESMIPFKGHLSWVQRMPQKPVKVGIKLFAVADAHTGY